jgi:uncharacterized protein YdcH (DUF465 family)
MSHTPHELAAEFPEYVAQMRHLKETDGHFSRLYEQYHAVNGKVHRAETDIEPADDMTIVALRKERMRLKDEIYGMLARHEPEAEKLD